MAHNKFGQIVAGAGIAGVMGFIAYGYLFRPWASRWGATHAEVYGSLPGDGLVPRPRGQSTHAITIDAPASEIWPWLVQMGQGRGGFYSYDRLENLIGLDIHSANEIIPRFQSLNVGDIVHMHPTGGLEVAALEPERDLVFYADADTQAGRRSEMTGVPGDDPLDFVSTWSFHLRPLNSQTTRLVVRSWGDWLPNVGAFLLWGVIMEPAHFIMGQKMLRGIKKRAETPRISSGDIPQNHD